MNNRIILPSGQAFPANRTGEIFAMLLLCIITGTFLRMSLLLLYPFIAIMFAAYFRFRLTSSVIVIGGLALVSFILSIYPQLFLKYKLLSLFYVLPFLLLFFSKPQVEQNAGMSRLSLFMLCLSIVAGVNDLIGFVQIIITPNSDDSFRGLYSQYSISLNGLMLINAILFFYYFNLFLGSKKLKYLLLFAFFGIAANLGFYGAGLIVCLFAFVATFLKFNLVSLIRTSVIAVLAFATIYFSMLLIKPITLQYNKENIQKILKFDIQNGPRKLLSFYNYAISYPRNFKDFVFGSGPGTFLSRSAFMVGSPSYFQAMAFIKDDDQPYYFRNYGYTLWNEKNTVKELFLDGFRNQPFSTVLAFLGEYGALFSSAFLLLFIHHFSKVRRVYSRVRLQYGAMESYRLFKFLMILLPLLFLIDNYVEYPEIILVIVPAIKFAQADLLTRQHNADNDEQTI